MIHSRFLQVTAICAVTIFSFQHPANAANDKPASAQKPNVIIIYSDDVGYGDVSCDGPSGRVIHTPNIDALAKNGLRFTDAHSPSSTCTPSRFALMTGEYAWRQKGTDILPGNAPLLIKPGSTTLPSIFKKAGYDTAAIGKWHMGLGNGDLDWNGDIKPGPLEVGFDSCFLFPATADRVPTVYLKNHRIVNLDPKDPISVSYRGKPSVLSASQTQYPIGRGHHNLETKMKSWDGHDDSIINGIGRIGFMSGGKSALWKDQNLAITFTKHAVDFIKTNKSKPFFLYFAINDIHVPRVPNPRFVGKSGMGPRSDCVIEMDWAVGQITKTLEKLGLEKNTIVIFTSDNGPVINDGYVDESKKFNGNKPGLHHPAGDWSGGKYTLFEGGTRVPMIISWPGHIKQGVSHAMVSHVDFLSSFASMIGMKLPQAAALDSLNELSVLLGKSAKGRNILVEHSMGKRIALRKDYATGIKWKYIPQKSLGRRAKGPKLFNLSKDPGEKQNVAKENPEVVSEMNKTLNKQVKDGRSRF